MCYKGRTLLVQSFLFDSSTEVNLDRWNLEVTGLWPIAPQRVGELLDTMNAPVPITFLSSRDICRYVENCKSDGYGVTLPGRRIKRPEVGELFRVGYRSMSQYRKRLRDRLSDDRNARNSFKGFFGKCNH